MNHTALDELNRRLDPSNRKPSTIPGHLQHVDKIKCADGLEISVQASEYHYCSPRDNYGNWDQVELGYPTESLPELLKYAEDKDKPTDTVYGYVPVDLVAQVIEKHGGFVS